MFLNIITPCSRPKNLHLISKSINIPKENYRWIVVVDSDFEVKNELIPDNCEIYYHTNMRSISGNSQRNFGLEMIDYGYVYFNDDDTLIHEDLWDNIKDVEADFISFAQAYKNNNLRLIGNNIEVGYIDSHNFIVNFDKVRDIRWQLDVYYADGIYAKDCYNRLKNNKLYINKILSIYNLLNNNVN